MTDIEKTQGTETAPSAWDRFRAFVKANKGKIIGGFTAVVAYLAGDGTVSTLFQGVWSAIFGG